MLELGLHQERLTAVGLGELGEGELAPALGTVLTGEPDRVRRGHRHVGLGNAGVGEAVAEQLLSQLVVAVVQVQTQRSRDYLHQQQLVDGLQLVVGGRVAQLDHLHSIARLLRQHQSTSQEGGLVAVGQFQSGGTCAVVSTPVRR